jgi:hypothetical protein
MTHFRSTLLAGAIAALPCFAQPAPPELSTSHDGRWSVHLHCPDVRSQKGVVSGYTYDFVVQIRGGRLDGEGRSAPPAFIRFTGQVFPDGTLEIDANGVSGNPETTFGKIARGTPYRYTMKGTLGSDRGKADRVELRPSTVEFFRQN